MSFGDDLRKVCERAKSTTSAVVRSVVLLTAKEMKERTPVAAKGGGRLRANLVCGIGQINTYNQAAPGSDPIPRIESSLAQWKAGDTIYLTNSVPYAIVVEYGLYGKPPGSANGPKTVGGFSSQSIGGFARLSAQNVKEHFRREVAGLK